MLPSAKQISGAIEGVFVLEDWHNFGSDYDKTLMHWFENFKSGWNTLKKNYDECFFSDVEILPAFLRRFVPCPVQPTLANCSLS
jgi:hypothetical protein